MSAAAFPFLDADEMAILRPFAVLEDYADGQTVVKPGEADIDFFVVESGFIDILNPIDNNSLLATHSPSQFVGDIDLLTRRPVLMTAVARTPTRVLRLPGGKLRELLNTVPRLSEKLLTAFMQRRELLQQSQAVGLRVTGPGSCKDTNAVREFLYKNFVPFVWYDSDGTAGKERLAALGNPKKSPVIECADGTVLINPSLREIGRCAGIWHGCPVDKTYDLAVVGAGPAGITAAVYAASEGLSTIVLDRLGPGGQAGGSSKIENFIGFPAGLSGTELSTRGVLQMLKFGARIVTPVNVNVLHPSSEPGQPHALELDCGATLHAHIVLVATGASWRKLTAKGAEQYDRAGIYYACTTVEGFLYKDKDVAVVGAGNSAGQAAMFLAESCARTVHMLIRGPALGPGMSDYLAARIRATPNITVHINTEVSEVHGAHRRIEHLTLTHRDGSPNSTLPAAAIFVFIGAEPHSKWLPEDIARDDLGYLATGHDAKSSGRWPLEHREPCPLETSLPGILAAGDVRAGSTKRVGFAVGDGALAVTCTHRLRSMIDAPTIPSVPAAAEGVLAQAR